MVLGIPKMMQKTEIIKVQRRNWIELLESESQLIDYGKVGRGGMRQAKNLAKHSDN